jgi:hypothetical protein
LWKVSVEKKQKHKIIQFDFFSGIAAIFIRNQELDHAAVLILLLYALMVWVC